MSKTQRYTYVTEEGLNNLVIYKYHGNDRSILAKRLQPWWNYVVTLLPLNMAPNLVTLIGFFFIVFSFLLQMYYCPNYEGNPPYWIYIIHALCVFVYQTMDAIDGKQARRTGASSPLGELFDHGCDSMTATFMLLTVGATLQVGTGWFLYIMLLVDLIAFYFAQWEEYHTDVLDLGLINVTEAQYAAISIHLVSAFIGPQFWNRELALLGFSIQYKYLVSMTSLIGLLFNIYESLVKVIKFIKSNNNSQDITISKLNGLIPVGIVSIFGTLWGYYSSTNIIYNNPTYFLISIGFLFSNLVGKIVLARVCKMRYSTFHIVIIPVLIGFIHSFFGLSNLIITETNYIKIWCGFSILSFLHLSMEVINSFCDKLDINCLTIKHKKQQ